MKTWTTAALTAVLLNRALCFAQAPPNDDFANRIVLSGSSITFTGTLDNATLQSGEPNPANPCLPCVPYVPYYLPQLRNASVWWSWTADADSLVTIDVRDFSTNTFQLGGIDVWSGSGSVSNLVFVNGTNPNSGRHCFFSFYATNGVAYQLRAIGTNFGSFTLRLTETNVPVIIIQPVNRTVTAGGSTFFGVVAASGPYSSPDPSYQWRLNGTNLPGETFAILGLDTLTTNRSGNYSVIVSNNSGTAMSDTAVLNVTPSTTGPQLIAGTAATGQFSFSILGDAGRFYRIFSSSNLASWTEENSFPAQFNFYSAPSVQPRNGIVYNDSGPVAVPQSAATKFYRVVNYTPPAPTNAICINHLAEIRFAKEAWALTTKQSEGATPAGEQIAPYFKNAIPACPLDVTQNSENSYVYRDLLHNPACRISLSHVLEQPEP